MRITLTCVNFMDSLRSAPPNSLRDWERSPTSPDSVLGVPVLGASVLVLPLDSSSAASRQYCWPDSAHLPQGKR